MYQKGTRMFHETHCGGDECTGFRDRCLEELTTLNLNETPDVVKKECPKNCEGSCEKTYVFCETLCMFVGSILPETWNCH